MNMFQVMYVYMHMYTCAAMRQRKRHGGEVQGREGIGQIRAPRIAERRRTGFIMDLSAMTDSLAHYEQYFNYLWTSPASPYVRTAALSTGSEQKGLGVGEHLGLADLAGMRGQGLQSPHRYGSVMFPPQRATEKIR